MVPAPPSAVGPIPGLHDEKAKIDFQRGTGPREQMGQPTIVQFILKREYSYIPRRVATKIIPDRPRNPGNYHDT
jgi:hypothetical protein